MNYLQNNRSNSGFTLIETITALLMIGILSAIAAPSWFALIKTQHLNIAQDQVYRAMREAQSKAKKARAAPPAYPFKGQRLGENSMGPDQRLGL